MKKTFPLSVIALSAVAMLTGCGSTSGQIVNVNSYKGQKSCNYLDKDLLKVDEYIEKVSNTDAFHLEEEGLALMDPDISTSTNKPKMLKDANNLRDSLMVKKKNMGCK